MFLSAIFLLGWTDVEDQDTASDEAEDEDGLEQDEDEESIPR
jgi:hypothetical protein